MSSPPELLAWYDAHSRDLPWRADRAPYKVWISEIMLQQTRVETVLPYYRRFLERFPTVEELAAAELEEVLAQWSGLGYYRRARQLHAAARQVAEAGSFPSTVEGLRELPGIGAYTAAAVGSICFGLPEPVLDGNVERVMARRLALAEDPKRAAPRRRLHAAAAELLDPERPGDSNQALMELGATICTPRRPRCLLCPLRQGCAAADEGEPELYPPPRARRRPERRRLGVAVVEDRGRILLYRRPDDSTLLAGTWELPWFEWEGDDSLARGAAALARRYGGTWQLGEELARVSHGITHRALDVQALASSVAAEEPESPEGAEVAEGPEAGWFSAGDRRQIPHSSLVRKVLVAAGLARSS